MNGSRRVATIIAATTVLSGSLCGYSKSGSLLEANSKSVRKGNVARLYTVQKGDNLFRIASSHGTTVAALKSLNGLKSNTIRIGEELKIPFSRNVTASDPRPLPPSRISEPATDRDDDSDDQELRTRIVQAGFQMLGVRYHWSGGSKENGFDCSGLVKALFSEFNIELPRTSREQYKQGEKVDRDKLEMGDLVFFSSGGKRPTHVGIYIGNNKFLHAAIKARQVIISDLNKIWYSVRYLGARRVILEDSASSKTRHN